MKLKNKKTGEIVEVESCNSATGTIGLFFAEGRECDRAYNSLADLCKEWEDAPEVPKEYWVIDIRDGAGYKPYLEEPSEMDFEIGNYFETEEEAELVVRKLKAWKKLKDKGFKFKEWKHTPFMETVDGYNIHIEAYIDKIVDVMKDLDLLFSRGEE